MNLSDNKYSKFALVKEMMETPTIIKNFHTKDISDLLAKLKETKKIFFTGEGSSRIFPAKNTIYTILKNKIDIIPHTEGSRQAAELNLSDYVLFGASNSGKTNEVISLFKMKKAKYQFALTAFENTPLGKLSDDEFVLNCGKEDAVAATKSVIEQALFYHKVIAAYNKHDISDLLDEFSKKAEEVLTLEIDKDIIDYLVQAPVLYFAGRNNGVAEEATLKTNEITRKKSDFLEGTYAVHGIEEVMNADEAVIVIDPFPEEEQKFKEVLVDGVGMKVFAISSRDTLFPTIKIPSMQCFDGYLQLMTCWNLLVEVGIAEDINLDKPQRARKVGNEYKGE